MSDGALGVAAAVAVGEIREASGRRGGRGLHDFFFGGHGAREKARYVS